MSKCWTKLPCIPLQTLAVRVVFFIHCVVITYRVVVAYNNTMYWLLTLLTVGIITESVITLWKNGGNEWKWFSPGIFCYLLATLPSLWLLELQLMDVRLEAAFSLANNSSTTNFGEVLGVNIPVSLDLSGWALAMEQALLFILIIGRWVMPKGDITRDQLSQLLLVFLGMAADIMELFEVFKEEKVIYAQHLIYPILSLWTWSLFQYALVITSAKARKSRFGGMDDEQSVDIPLPETSSGCCKRTCGIDSVSADVIGIMTTIVMQDGPFLCFRMYLLVGLGIASQMMIFFTCKNLLVLLLQIYRLIIIYFDPDDDDEASRASSPTRRAGFNDIEMVGGDSGDWMERPSGDGKPGGEQTLQVRPGTPSLGKGKNRVSPSPTSVKQQPLARDGESGSSDKTVADSGGNKVGAHMDPSDSNANRPYLTDDELEHPHSVGSMSSSEEGYCSNANSKQKGRKNKRKLSAVRAAAQTKKDAVR